MIPIQAAWPPPTIVTPRLKVRSSLPSDRSAYIELLSDASVWRYLGGAPSRSDLEVFVPEVPGNYPGIFIVELNGVLIGRVLLERRLPERPGHISEGGRELEIGYYFFERYWGQGYAAEAVRVVLDWAAAHLPDSAVVLCAQIANERSVRLAHRLDFVEVDRFIEFGAEQWLGRRAL
jgi:RimJ/RimL family protein N-acetyltransferase